MNPPDYYPLPAEVLEVAELACKKYLASSETIPEVVELVTDLLMGGDWPDCSIIVHDIVHLSCFYKAMYYLLPTEGEKKRRVKSRRYQYHTITFNHFKKYLDEPS